MKSIKFFAASFLLFSVFACNKTNTQATGVGDAIIVVKKINNQIKYGVSLYAYTYSSFESVTAVSSADPTTTYTLKSNQGYNTNFYYEMPDDEYTTSKPAPGTFTFSAKFKNGTTQEFTDELTDNVLALPNITKCEYNATNHQLEVAWDLADSADSYAINIFDGTTIVFASSALASTTQSYSINVSGGGWASGFTPENGKTYTVRVLAFLYEPNGDNYNVQASAVKDTTAVWGN